MAEPSYEDERRRLAGMLPGADISSGGLAEDGVLEVLAVVDDLDRPIPVLVERGGYTHRADVDAVGTRWLEAPGVRLELRASGSG